MLAYVTVPFRTQLDAGKQSAEFTFHGFNDSIEEANANGRQ